MHIFTSLWMLLLPEMNGICIFRALFTSLECKSTFSFVAVQNWVLEAASFCPKSFNCPSGSDLLTLRVMDSQNCQQKQGTKGVNKPRAGSLFEAQSHGRTCFAVIQGRAELKLSFKKKGLTTRNYSKLIYRNKREFNSQDARVVLERAVRWMAWLLCCPPHCFLPPWSISLLTGVLPSASKWSSQFCDR